ncbi:MAG: lysophospholipid acyltransferase family protein [Verrucomicrobiota bacterium]
MHIGRAALEYLLARLILTTLGLLPRSVALRLAMGLARQAPRWLPALRRVGRRNLELAFPELTISEHERILAESFANLGRIIAEFGRFPSATATSLAQRVDFVFPPEKRARYDEAKAAGRGIIFVTPHLGNWEILVLAASALFEPITYLARPLDNQLLEGLTSRVRSRFGNRPISKRDSIMEGLKILDAGGNLGLLADVNTLQRDGVFVPFFGRLACTTRAVAMLALRTNALIVPTCGVWEEKEQRYRVLVGELVEVVRTGRRKRDIIEITARYTAEMEKFIRAYPGQWVWVHRRWKTRPKGEPDIYARD